MAIERNVPKNIKNYEPKIVFNLTSRQLAFLAPAVAISLAIVFGLKRLVPEMQLTERLTVAALFAVPLFMFGFYRPYGQTLWQFLRTTIVSSLLSPAKRKYKTSRECGNPTVEISYKDALKKHEQRPKSKDKKLRAYK